MKNIFTKHFSFKSSLWLATVAVLAMGVVDSFATNYSSSAVTQVTTAAVAGVNDQEIMYVRVTGSAGGTAASICSIQFTMQNTDDADISNAKLYFTTTATFSTATQVGATIPNPTGTITFTTNHQAIGNSSNHYYWLAYDIKGTAPNCNSFDALVPTNGIAYKNAAACGAPTGTATPTTPDPTGNRAIEAPGCWNYCTSTHTVGTTYYLSNVTFGSINNTTTNTCGSMYCDYTAQSTAVSPSSSYDITVTAKNGANPAEIYVHFDWNNDGTFANDATERYYIGQSPATGPTTLGPVSIAVPAGATPGTTRMRVVMSRFDDAIDPCNPHASGYGETEDYSVNVCPIAPPAAPTTTGASRCGTGTVTLTASGAGAGEDYKWYDALTGGTLLQTNGATYATPSISVTTTYYASIYNTANPCGESGRTAVVATINTAPAITVQPSSASECQNGTVTFTVTATGTGLLPQWQESTGGPFSNITNGGIYSGATTLNLTLTGITAGMNGYQYKVIVNGTCTPSATSSVATLTVTGGTAPTPANAGSDQSVTAATTTLAGNTITVGSGLWSVVSGTATITTPTSPTSGVTALAAAPSVATLRWTSTNGACTSSDDMVITRYCLGTYTNDCGFAIDITNVTVSDINNSSGCYDGGTTNYTNFTNIVGSIEAGVSYPITITRGGDVNGNWWGVWVDWSKDGDFLDADEFMAPINSPAGTSSGTGTLVVPSGLASGTKYTMRIRSKETSAMTQATVCDLYAYGEQEDYTLKVAPSTCFNSVLDAGQGETAIDCGGLCFTPVAGTITGGGSYACGTPVALTLIGAAGTIQWQYSVGGGPWTDIPDENGTSYSKTITQNIDFRAVVSGGNCAGVNSNTASVTITGTVTNTWLTTGTTSWTTNSNWSQGVAPSQCHNVVIPSGGSQPTVSPAGDIECNNITINSGATLTLNYNTTKNFQIWGNILNNGTINSTNTGKFTLRGVGTTWGGTGTYIGTMYMMIGNDADVTLTNNVNVYSVEMTNTSPYGKLSLGSNTLTVTNSVNQALSSIYVNTGVLDIAITADMTLYPPSLYPETGTVIFRGDANFIISGVWDNIGGTGFYNVEFRPPAGRTYQISGSQLARNWFKVSGNVVNFTYWAGPAPPAASPGPPYTIKVVGDFINDATTFTNTSDFTFIMNGTAAQNITGANASTFNKLTIDNSAASGTGVTQIQPVTVTNIFALTDGEFNLNNLTATVTNAATGAITRTTGYVVSESESSILQWNMGSTTGNHIFPFGTTAPADNYIPFTFNNKGNSSGNVSVSSWSTNNQNTPKPSGVTNMLGAGDSVTTAIDRFWNISTVTNPMGGTGADITFTYRGAENTITNPTEELAVQHWTGSVWNDGKGGAAGTYALSSPTANGTQSGTGNITITSITEFSPFAVVRRAAPLPIELMSFTALPDKENVILRWSTASEINNEYFTIERSKDGKEFEQVAKVKSKAPGGNSSVQLEYADKDDKPYKGVSYYRLKQTDYDGKYAYSALVAVKLAENGVTSLYVYPNPANNKLNIVVGKNEKSVVKIYDITGQIVSEKNICNQPTGICQLEIENLPKGVYFVSVNDGTDVRYARFVKE